MAQLIDPTVAWATISPIVAKLNDRITKVIADLQTATGIKPGAIVLRRHDSAQFMVTDVAVSRYPYYSSISVSVWGNKLRRNGTYGDHAHYIGGFEELELAMPFLPPADRGRPMGQGR